MTSKRPYVLIVDDKSNVSRITSFLGDTYETIGLHTFADAIFHLENEQADVLLAGQDLVDGSGTKLLAKAADISPLTCRILMSDSMTAPFLLEAINVAKVTHFISKPAKKESLTSAISDALQARGRSREALTNILLGKHNAAVQAKPKNDHSRTRPQGWPDHLVEDLLFGDTERLAWFLDPDLHIGVALLSPEDVKIDARSWSAELELRLITSLRETDHCFRVGDRSFLVLFGHTSRTGCKSAGRRFGANLSGGVCLQTMQWPDDSESRDPSSFAKVVLSQI